MGAKSVGNRAAWAVGQAELGAGPARGVVVGEPPVRSLSRPLKFRAHPLRFSFEID